MWFTMNLHRQQTIHIKIRKPGQKIFCTFHVNRKYSENFSISILPLEISEKLHGLYSFFFLLLPLVLHHSLNSRNEFK